MSDTLKLNNRQLLPYMYLWKLDDAEKEILDVFLMRKTTFLNLKEYLFQDMRERMLDKVCIRGVNYNITTLNCTLEWMATVYEDSNINAELVLSLRRLKQYHLSYCLIQPKDFFVRESLKITGVDTYSEVWEKMQWMEY